VYVSEEMITHIEDLVSGKIEPLFDDPSVPPVVHGAVLQWPVVWLQQRGVLVDDLEEWVVG
jgi:hypothetical protein